MKILYLLLFSLLLYMAVYSQPCKTIRESFLFPGIQFGSRVPVDLSAPCFKGSKIGDTYYLRYDSLTERCKKSYAALFHALSPAFTMLEITTNNKEQVFAVNAWFWLSGADLVDFAKNELPGTFTTIYDKLVLLYGKPITAGENVSPDSFFTKYNGTTRRAEWECNKIRLDLKVTYGAEVEVMNLVDLYIKDTKYELVEQELLQ